MMDILNRLLYFLVIKPISYLPPFLMYKLSDLTFIVFYRLVGYRKRVVWRNIQNSFPNESPAEQNKIMRDFYKHFCDLLVESLMIFSISSKAATKRMRFKNPELLDRHFQEGRSVIIAGGHYNNWELFAVAVNQSLKHHVIGLYKPLKSPFWDDLMRVSRGRFGLSLASIKKVKDVFEDLSPSSPKAIVFATDQSPSNPDRAYWTRFLNQDTSVLFGTEKFANDYDCPVYFCTLNKLSRGFYEGEFKLIAENPKLLPYGQLTELHTKMLEDDIIQNPAYWLWSHKRWKHKKNVSTSTEA
ncbi:MAG: lysophospholipid acyltransferase family protein [Bacteroidota bacterium]